MGLNIVEALIVAAAVDVVPSNLISPLECNKYETAALYVLMYGLRLENIDVHPTHIHTPWHFFYEGMAARRLLRAGT